MIAQATLDARTRPTTWPGARRALAVAGFGTTLGLALGACAADPLATAPRAPSRAAGPSLDVTPSAADNVVLRWSGALLAAVRTVKPGPPIVARAIGVTHTAMYDAWAAYDAVALATQSGGALRRPAAERTDANKQRAVSYAAYRALVDLFPTQRAAFDALMADLGYAPLTGMPDLADAAGVGTAAADAVLAVRHHDGSSQLGDLHAGAYSDYTNYAPVNTPDQVVDPTHWQPLRVSNGAGGWVVQRFIAPQWGLVVPFALTTGKQFRPPPPGTTSQHGAYVQQVEDMLHTSAGLTDQQKVVAEYWADGPNSELPPGHWCLFAAWVSHRDRHTIDDDARMFFALGNAVMDAGIAAWDAKRAYDAARPITAIHYWKAGKPIRAWGGPGLGTVQMLGDSWIPYQPLTVVTPAFPEYVSGHSAFSAAAATVLANFAGSDTFGASATFAPGWSRVEPGLTPARPVTLAWPTFTAAADEAGLSRRYGGIHFAEGDLAGRTLGRQVGAQVWSRAAGYWTGASGSARNLAASAVARGRDAGASR